MHSIESIVIDWSHQIQEVLKQDSSQPLLEGLNPGPLVEVEFSIAKCTNLEDIYAQLTSTQTQKMAQLLEKSQSSYYPAFRNLFTGTATALEEAQDIDAHLTSLHDFFQTLDSSEFSKSAPRYLTHSVCLLWANSKYYCRGSSCCYRSWTMW